MDTAVQQYFFDSSYKDATVYCSGNRCRNNIGQWAKKIQNSLGVSFTLEADYSFVLWGGKSQGSITNVLELVKGSKKALVYHSPQKAFYKISDVDDASELISHCDQQLVRKLRSKLVALLPENRVDPEISMSF